MATGARNQTKCAGGFLRPNHGDPPRPGNGYGFYSAKTAKTAKNQQIRVLTVRIQPRHGTRHKNEI